MTLARCLALCFLVGFFLTTAEAQSAPSQQERFDQAKKLVMATRYAEALTLLEPLARENRHPMVRYLLGLCFLEVYRFADAERPLREIVALPEATAAWHQILAKCLKDQGKNAEARGFLDRAIGLAKPGDPVAAFHYARATCDLDGADLKAAEAHLRECLRRDPDHALARFQLGRVLLDRGSFSEALSELRRAVEADAQNSEARWTLGLAAQRLGETDLAEASFRRVLSEVPGHAGAAYNLGRLLCSTDRAKEGRAMLEMFKGLSNQKDEIDHIEYSVTRSPENADLRVTLARALLRVGRVGDATRALEAARRLSETSQIYELLGEAFERQGRKDDARRARAHGEELKRAGR